MRTFRVVLVLAVVSSLGVSARADEADTPVAAAPKHYGFQIEGALVSPGSIVAGGPGRDGIRSVDEPEFATLEDATWMVDDTPVLGVRVGGEARAYPVHLLEYHQIVNDTLGGVPIAVTYDPLTATHRVFKRELDGSTLSFGVSGLLYNSGFLMYDRQSESLWSQFEGRAIAGPLAGRKLESIRVSQPLAGAWAEAHPDSKVLARPDMYHIDYRYSPFAQYTIRDSIPFPVNAENDRYHPKRLVVGLVADGVSAAILDSAVMKAGGSIDLEFEGRPVRVSYDRDNAVFSWEVPDDVQVTESYWFAWKAFHPDTRVLGDPPPRAGE